MRDFKTLIKNKWHEKKFLCVGLDPDIAKIPKSVFGKDDYETIFNFNAKIIDSVKDLVCAFKPNSAFYESRGIEGWRALKDTCDYILKNAQDIPIILDAKRGDIGNTNEKYAEMAYDFFGADAVTVHPYQGLDALAPFFTREEKVAFVLARTSNADSGQFQNEKIIGEPFFVFVARKAYEKYGEKCGLVAGATHPSELRLIRDVVPNAPILIPGIGAQEGSLSESVLNGVDKNGEGIIVNASRSVLYASSGEDFAEKAQSVVANINSQIVYEIGKLA